MDEWEAAYAELQALSCNDTGPERTPGTGQQRGGLSLAQQIALQGSGSSQPTRQAAPAPRARPSLAQQLQQQQLPPAPHHHQQLPPPTQVPAVARPAGRITGGRGAPTSGGASGLPCRCPLAVTQGWLTGPIDPQGERPC